MNTIGKLLPTILDENCREKATLCILPVDLCALVSSRVSIGMELYGTSAT